MDAQKQTTAWVELTQTDGDVLADMMVQQLLGAGIAAYKWQEGAGSALGLTVGPLGTTHVMVEEDQVDEARAFLALDETALSDSVLEPAAFADTDDEDEVEDGDDLFTRFSRVMLAVVAVVFSPIGVLIAYLMKFWPQGEDDI